MFDSSIYNVQHCWKELTNIMQNLKLQLKQAVS